MNFFERQEESKQKTLQLLFLFILAVAGIVFALYIAAIVIMNYLEIETPGQQIQLADPVVFLWVLVLTLTIIMGGSLVKIMALRRGGQYVAESLGGRLIQPSTIDPAEKRFINIVEEMAIASGVAVPMAYVLDNEEGINAFAAGYKPEDAAVAVTKGCLKMLTRDELQGVIGHEFSHILNGDMRLNIRLIGFISGILILATIGQHLIRVRGRSSKDSAPAVFMGLALIIIGYVGVFFARLIQMAVSRQREYLADASSVQFTRNPIGLANALKKIGGFSKGSIVKAPLASEASHMFFGNAVKSIFASHPPLADRIRRIDPSFTGDFAAPVEISSFDEYDESPVMGLSAPEGFMSMRADKATSLVGTVSPDHVGYSAKLLEAIPLEIRKELADPFGATAVVFALLLDDDALEKKHQIEQIGKIMPAECISHMRIADKVVTGTDMRLRLPMADLAIPTLRQMSAQQFEQFKAGLNILIESDQKVSLFEFCLQQIITHRLEASFTVMARRKPFTKIEPLLDDAVNLISKLAEVGHSDKADAIKAYDAAVKKLSKYGTIKKTPVDSNVSYADLGRSMANIANAKPGIREVVFDACASCVLFDRRITLEEAELIRAIAYCLDLPMAPFLENSL